ncbi:MAG: response regulator transcription factor [Sandaracinaceae bacterium]|nr:response regulator transcription factor [Sandaracinaceae bacterium]
MAGALLLIDDDRELCELLVEYLGEHGWTVEARHDGEDGLRRALAMEPALVVLDVMLPRLDGFEVLRRLRTRSEVPVLMLTARGEDVDRIVGLEMGADDYLKKPFNPRELLARIRAIRRRTEARRPVIAAGALRLDAQARVATVDGAALALTTTEFALLEVLLRHAGAVVSREELSVEVLGRRFSPMDRSVDVHVSGLRRKLAGSSAEGALKTVRGHGYQLAAEPD